MTTRRTALAGMSAMVPVAMVVGGCFGNGGSLLNLASGLSAAPPAGGIRFAINANITLAGGSSYVDFHAGSDPDANFTGTISCDSRHFLADYSDNIQMLFSYSAAAARLLIGSQFYDSNEPPDQADGYLGWRATSRQRVEIPPSRSRSMSAARRPPPASPRPMSTHCR